MKVQLIPQAEFDDVSRIRIGDFLNKTISKNDCTDLKFAVAYVRMSGLNRLEPSFENLINRGGKISASVGIDGEITSIEALEAIKNISKTSTIFHTISGFIFHPKIYLMSGKKSAVVVIGSANLTRDGLFRNIEVASALFFNLTKEKDKAVFELYKKMLDEFLNIKYSNIQPIDDTTISSLIKEGVIKHESESFEPGPKLISKRKKSIAPSISDIYKLFPPLKIPVAPPILRKVVSQKPRQKIISSSKSAIQIANTFMMQLSFFDSSHRTGVPGTPEILIPHAAISFFPKLSISGRKYPDVMFDVVLNTPSGRERHRYRLWYYEMRATGTKIDEYRLRMDHDTVDLSTIGGGDLLVINKLPKGSDPAYETTILNKQDAQYSNFYKLCTNIVQGKRWGIQ